MVLGAFVLVSLRSDANQYRLMLQVHLMFEMESHMMEFAIAVRLDLIGVLADHIA